ncbi:MAG: DUF2147 domain-containing protein [Bacteroidaceae bacterium]|nr:DUF2147 domain-containing protein [Bacteroidaceae bacterium]
MKKIIFTLLCGLLFTTAAQAQEMNSNGDNILGEYISDRGGSKSKIKVTKEEDGTYMAQVYWVENELDKDGNKRKDVKNPDKKLRNVDIDKVVLIKGLKYNAKKQKWGGADIYDPTMGMKVDVDVEFVSPTKLKLFGNILGIGKKVYWEKFK